MRTTDTTTTATLNPYNNIVNVAEYYQVEYWTKRFGITAEQLKTAVKAVGVSAEAIANFLMKR